MPHNISTTELAKISLFSICSKKFGYGHYNRIQNLISILKDKNKKFAHYSYGKNFKNKKKFLEKLNFEVNLDDGVVLDVTNSSFLNYNTILKIKKILGKKKSSKIWIIDSPTEKNLSTILKLDYTKTLIPFEVNEKAKKKLSKIKKISLGLEYFIYPINNLKKKKKIYDITLSFGGSDNCEGTFYAMKLLENLKVKKNIVIIIGKYFKDKYKRKILHFCKKNKFKTKSFSKNFYDILNKSRILITNSGLTKYEGNIHGIPVIVFSDDKERQKIDEVFIKKTKQAHFSYKKIEKTDNVKLKKILQNIDFKSFDKIVATPNINKIRNFFKNAQTFYNS